MAAHDRQSRDLNAPVLAAYRSTPAASPSFGECFQMFELLHLITTKHAAITRITRWAGAARVVGSSVCRLAPPRGVQAGHRKLRCGSCRWSYGVGCTRQPAAVCLHPRHVFGHGHMPGCVQKAPGRRYTLGQTLLPNPPAVRWPTSRPR